MQRPVRCGIGWRQVRYSTASSAIATLLPSLVITLFDERSVSAKESLPATLEEIKDLSAKDDNEEILEPCVYQG